MATTDTRASSAPTASGRIRRLASWSRAFSTRPSVFRSVPRGRTSSRSARKRSSSPRSPRPHCAACVGVARLYAEGFDEAEAALLEAVAASIAPALERLRLAEERDRLYQHVHERAQAARVIGAIADGVVLVDEAGIVQLWNPGRGGDHGAARGTAVVGRPLHEVVPGWPAVADSLGTANDPASSSARATVVPVDVSGREVWLSIRGVGLAEGTVYAFHDLTEERALEQLKADFIATVSHELRTPLAAVHGAAKTLLRDDVDLGHDVARQLLKLVSEQSDRLAGIVEDILLASRLDSPELELTVEHVDVAELAADVIAAARVQAGERLTLELVSPPSLPPVAADRDKLRQVLVNLVANAVKYSPAGGRIAVEASAEDEPRHGSSSATRASGSRRPSSA